MTTASIHAATRGHDSLDRIYRAITLRTIPMLFVCYMCNYLDRINVGFAKLQMLDDLKMSETAFGLGAGIFFVGYVLAGVPSSFALRRISPRRWMCILMLVWGALSASLMWVKSPSSFYVLRFLTGVAEAGFFPSIVLYLAQWFPSSRRGRVMSLFMVSIPLSGLVGGPLSGWILQHFAAAPNGLAAWQWLYLLQGAPTIVMGLVLLSVLRDDVDHADWLGESGKQLIREDLERDARLQSTLHNTRKTARPALISHTVLMLGFVYFCIQMGVYAMNFWLPSIIRSLGFPNLGVVGLISAVPYLCAAVVMVFVGRSADAHQERRLHLGVPVLIGFVGLLLAATANGSIPVALGGLTLATAGTLTGLAMFWPFTSAVPGGSPSAPSVALINSVGQIAGFVSPYFIGWVRDTTHSTTPALYLLSSAMALGAILVMRPPRAISVPIVSSEVAAD